MSHGCCLPHLNSQKPSSIIPGVLFDPGVWKHPEGAEAAISAQGLSLLKHSAPGLHKVTSKDTPNPARAIKALLPVKDWFSFWHFTPARGGRFRAKK